MKDPNLLVKELTDEEFETIANVTIKDRLHPAKKLILFPQSNLEIFYNTNLSLSRVLQADRNWFLSNKPRLMDTQDFSTPSSFLAEIRAFGYLLTARLSVSPLVSKDEDTPDFEVKKGNDSVIIEVIAKQYKASESGSCSISR